MSAVPRNSVTNVANALNSLESAQARLRAAMPIKADPQTLRIGIEDNLRVQGVVDPFATVGYVATYFPGTAQYRLPQQPFNSGDASEQVGAIDIQLHSVDRAHRCAARS